MRAGLKLATAGLLAVLLSSLNPASARASDGPKACAPMAHRLDVQGLWLGHFTGGRIIHANRQKTVNWRNEYRCFTSARACHSWRAGMRRHWGHVNALGTCLALRGGGTRYVRGGVLVTRY